MGEIMKRTVSSGVMVLLVAFSSPSFGKNYPDPPAPAPGEEFVFVQGEVSLHGSSKHYRRIVAVEVDPGPQWANWKFDASVFYPKQTIRRDKPSRGRFVFCGEAKAAARGNTIILYAPIANESAFKNIRCKLSGYVRAYK
jgi:hypothetical protein